MEFALTILGVNGAAPAHGRFPTSQYLNIHNHHFLIDCGEGTQMRLSDFSVPRGKIDHIFISHLHGDHVFGLPGLLFSYALNNREKPLHIYSPPGLKGMIMAQLIPGGLLPFPVSFHVISTQGLELVFENNHLTVHSIPLRHRIPTSGFIFREKPSPKNINPQKIQEYGLTIPQIKAVKAGENIKLVSGELLLNEELTIPSYIPRSYAFVSDSMYHEEIIPSIKGVDLLYHETTFCNDAKENAAATMHSTAQQAANIAKLAGVGTLITGHYSTRYKDVHIFLEEASAVFPKTILGTEGETYKVVRRRQ